MDLVINQTHDRELISARSHVLRLHEENTQNFAKFLEDRKSDDFKQILLVLNTHEFVACGIKQRALDEKIYKSMYWSIILRDWDSFCGLVVEFRRIAGRPTLFQEFEWLANRWKKKKLNVRKP